MDTEDTEKIVAAILAVGVLIGTTGPGGGVDEQSAIKVYEEILENLTPTPRTG